MGEEIVRYLAATGATVALADRNLELARSVASDVVAAGGTCAAIPVDVAEESTIVTAFDTVAERFGRLDILVNNAGVQDRSYLLDTSVLLWDRIHAVNARGVFLCLREGARVMRGCAGGRIINISSVGSVHPVMPGLAAYNSAKAAVNGLTRSAALELAADGISVNAIFPGGIATRGAKHASGPPGSGRVANPPLTRRGLVPSDIAATVLFLSGPQGEVITGQGFTVDAGFLIG